jgi:hypothetical protein
LSALVGHVKKLTQEKINCTFAYIVTSAVRPEKISSPTFIIMEVKSVCLKYGGKTQKLLESVIIRMIRLP